MLDDEDIIVEARIPPPPNGYFEPLRRKADAAAHSAFWNRVWAHEPLSIESSYEARVLSAWRLIRKMAEMRGALKALQPLRELDEAVDVHDEEFVLDGSASKALVPVAVRGLIEIGLPLLPPLLTAHPDTVDRYATLVSTLARQMGLARHHKTEAAVPWLASAATVQQAWPPLDALIEFEEDLLAHTRVALIEKTNLAVVQDLREQLGVNEQASVAIVAMAITSLEGMSHLGNRSGMKAKVLARLEQQSHAAQQAFDHRGAAMIEREWWRVFRDEAATADDELDDMTDAIKQGASALRAATNDDDDYDKEFE